MYIPYIQIIQRCLNSVQRTVISKKLLPVNRRHSCFIRIHLISYDVDGCLPPDTSCVYMAISRNVETNNRFVREMFAKEMKRVSNDPDKTDIFKTKISGQRVLGALYTTNVGSFGHITGGVNTIPFDHFNY